MNPVKDNELRRRFELELEGGTAFIDYQRIGAVRVLTHAEVPQALRGRGFGAQLTAGTLELIRERGERVVPRCPYVAHFMRRHSEYSALLASGGPAPRAPR